MQPLHVTCDWLAAAHQAARPPARYTRCPLSRSAALPPTPPPPPPLHHPPTQTPTHASMKGFMRCQAAWNTREASSR